MNMSYYNAPQAVPPYPGLEHVPASDMLPQVVPTAGIEHIPSSHVWPQNAFPAPQYEKHDAGGITTEPGPRPSADHDKIFGLRRVTFFLILTIGLLLIGGAVGGGVGGSIAAKKKPSKNDSQSFVSPLVSFASVFD